MSKVRTYNSELVNSLLAEATTEEIRLTEKKMILAARIADAIKKRFKFKSDFAAAIRKKPSEITKWLSGTHNFTSETLFEIERILDIQLINLDSKPASYITYHISLKAHSEGATKDYWIWPTEGDQTLKIFKGQNIVSEIKPDYATN